MPSQRYNFAHRALPQVIHDDPQKAQEIFLGPESEPFLFFLWRRVGERLPEDERLAPQGLACSRHAEPGRGVAFVVTMPSPQCSGEAYLAAAVFVPGARKLLFSRHPPTVRYFTLELDRKFDGTTRTVLCERIKDGTHHNMGDGPPPEIDVFLARIWETESIAKLVAEGCALLDHGKEDEAFDVMTAAAAAAPGAAAAVPLAWKADIVARKLYGAGPEEQQRLYWQADELARDALSRNDDESRALAVLGRLARLQQRSPQTSVPAAYRAIDAGNALFGQERFEDAQRRYEEASHIQPELAEPVKFAGNCQYAIARRTGSAAHYSAAEQLFRRAIELDPQDAQAHHFLADTYLELSKTLEALAAACASIAANPAYYPAWQVVRSIRASQERPLRSFRIRPLAFVSREQGGKPTINVSTRVSGREAAVWMVYAAVKAGLVGAAPEETGSPAFGAELRALRAAAQEFAGQSFHEPPGTSATESAVVLRKLFEMDEKGDLPTAILLLAYNESFRDDLEALKRARPDACADFVHRYDLRPF